MVIGLLIFIEFLTRMQNMQIYANMQTYCIHWYIFKYMYTCTCVTRVTMYVSNL